MSDAGSPSVYELLSQLHLSHDRLAGVLDSLSDEHVTAQSYDDDWSIAQVASHLGSGAEIFGLMLTAGLDGSAAPGADEFQPIWARWNAKSPTEQAQDALRADAAFLGALDAMPDADRAGWHLDMFGSQQDLAGLLRMRLGEHALHTWDIAVTFDPDAVVPADAAALIVDNLSAVAARAGKPGEPMTVAVETHDPARRFRLEVSPDGVQLAPGSPEGETTARLDLSAEAFVRLVYGRLDGAHTPADVHADAVVLEALRQAFPGV